MNIMTIARTFAQATSVGTPINKKAIGACSIERLIRSKVDMTVGRYAPTLHAEQFRSFRAIDVVFPEQRGAGRKSWTPVLRFIVTPNKLRGVQVLMECSNGDEFDSRIRAPKLLCLTVRAAVRHAGLDQNTVGDAMMAFIDAVTE